MSMNAELRLMQVPRVPDQDVKWREVLLTGQKIIATGLSIYDHDLYVLVTAQPQSVNKNTANPRIVQEVQVRLNRLSTGEPHPDVRKTIISFETREEFLRPHVIIRYAGDNLLLVLWDRAVVGGPDDQVYIYAWKTGELKLRLSVPSQTYNYPLFLTTDIFLLPNRKTGELEYWRIPKNPSDPAPNQPFFVLSLPQCRSGRSFQSILCRAEPNPGTRSHGASKPFYDDPHQAIATFIIEVRSSARFGQRVTSFLLFVHRNSLVGCLEKFPLSTSFVNRPQSVPYDEWGPSICRWFSIDQRLWLATTFGQRCVLPPPKANTEGAPLTLLDFNPVNVAIVLAAERHRAKVAVLDDEGWNIAHNEHTGRVSEDNAENGSGCRGKDMEVSPQTCESSVLEVSPHIHVGKAETGVSPFVPRLGASVIARSMDPLNDPNGCFENTVYSSLPYTMRSSQEKYNSNALLLDEEGILCIKMNDDEMCITEVRVLHYGYG
ncbi:hypothetical protein P691DRAFT_30724 [Macrolepiota fuliginosa MF-IS2]|uniref:Uncharacterized protein n=1 Tax=Macrolepiota fuliginosa MF-IS2 TaxID=1400762 RepID=A0A9P5XCX2_9AGAR|nr:hypothetical protein P691DRAFT_30724 [Macrolepiota fuliginosa MF-IS2]